MTADNERSLATVAFAAIHARFALICESTAPRELLDAIAPDHLITAVRDGRRQGLAEFPLGQHARAALSSWAEVTARDAEGLRALWADADGRQRGAIVQSLKAGITSDEATLGVAIGSLFGPLGMTIGGALGGLLAGSKVDEDLRRSVTAYAIAVDAWYEASVERYNAVVPDAAARDDAAAGNGAAQPLGLAGWLVLGGFGLGLLAVLGGLGYGGYRAYAWLTAAPAVEQQPEHVHDDAGVVIAAPSAPTVWASEDGTRYRLEYHGRDIAFVVADAASARGRYHADETEFALTADDDGSYLVAHVVRPEPPRGAVYDESAYSSCARTVTMIDGAALRGRRTGRGFEIESAVVELPPRAFARGRRRTRIAGCTNLGAAVLFRRTVRLTPL